jgi:peptide/nickel transport system substrate-binding protein
MSASLESLFGDDWTVSPEVFDYSVGWRPPDYVTGLLATDWEFTTPGTMVVNLRQNVYWQNISPVNGRQFTSADVVYNFGRDFGHGDGFTTPSTYNTANPLTTSITSVTATGPYTVVFQFNTPNIEFILESMEALGDFPFIAQESVTQWGNINQWNHVIGTGPFIIQDFVDSSSITFVKNADYWGYDERYPQNQLPYIDTLKILIIPDQSTALSALRVGKIDVMEGISLQASQDLKQSNPNIMQLTMPGAQGMSIDPTYNKAPYTNINVRIALQEAINLPQIASSYYGGTCSPDPQTLTDYALTGWGFPYNEWPASLQAQYAYNPTNAKALLATAGFPNGFNTDCVANASGDLTLLQIVQSDFAAIGVNMSINTMASAAWTSYVRVAHSQDALAFSTGQLGFSSQPFRELQHFTTGYASNYEMVSDPNYDALYTEALAATTTDQVKSIVKEGNELVSQQQYSISLLNPSNFEVYQPWLKGYAGQYYGMSGGTGGGPLMLGYYASRFWIDQSAK